MTRDHFKAKTISEIRKLILDFLVYFLDYINCIQNWLKVPTVPYILI